MLAKALMPTMLVQEHKEKINNTTVHEVLTWFDQPCLCLWMRGIIALYNREYYRG